MKSADIAIFKSVAGRVRAMERPSWSQPSRERQWKMRKHFKAITNTQMYQRRRDLFKFNSGNGSGGPSGSGTNLPDPCEQPHRQSSLSAPILTHKYTSISPNLHSTCTCTAVPHIASIQMTHQVLLYQNACDALATYATHRIQLSIMVFDVVILS